MLVIGGADQRCVTPLGLLLADGPEGWPHRTADDVDHISTVAKRQAQISERPKFCSRRVDNQRPRIPRLDS